MNREPILFRVDATPETGYERLARCLTYASALQRRRRPTFFLSQLDPASLGLAVKRSGSEWLEAGGPAGSDDDLAELMQELRRINPAAVIVDAPGASEDWLTELVAAGPCVVSFDHQATVRLPSQMVINPLLGPGRESYEHGRSTQLLLGPRYAMVRSEIRRVRPARAQEPPQPFSALVALGDGPCPSNLAELARLLLSIPRLERVDFVGGPEHRHADELVHLAASYPDRIKLLAELPEIASRVARCHFALTTGNGFSLELACVGVPQLVIVQSEQFWPTAQRLEEEGAAICLGWHESVSPTTIRQAVQGLLTDPQERQAMARCGRQLIDARGPDRLVTALEVVLHRHGLVRMAA